MVNGKIVQKLCNDYVFKLDVRNEDGEIEKVISRFVTSFNLENAPLLREPCKYQG